MYFNEILHNVENDHDYTVMVVGCGCHVSNGLECDIVYAKNLVPNNEEVVEKDPE